MVRAGVVPHPAQWHAGGNHEIHVAPQRYRIVNRAALAENLSLERLSRLAVVHAEWIEATLHVGGQWRVPVWSESLAVGEREFVARAGTELGVRARHRQSETGGNMSVLRDPSAVNRHAV
jgi:hypothetical protein